METLDKTIKNVSYAMCKRIVLRDARIQHYPLCGWWSVTLEGREYQGQTKADAVAEAAVVLQLRLDDD